MIRHRGGSTRHSGDEDQQVPTSPARIGRALRNAREEPGLDLLTVHDRLGRPITLLEALEAGDLGALPDQVLALSTLRRYAAFLSLDGDAMALQLLDAWPEAPAPATRRRAARESQLALTGVVTAVNGPGAPAGLHPDRRGAQRRRVLPLVVGTGGGRLVLGTPDGHVAGRPAGERPRDQAGPRQGPAPAAGTGLPEGRHLGVGARPRSRPWWDWASPGGAPRVLVQYHVLRVVNPLAAPTTAPPAPKGKGKGTTHPRPPAVQLTSTDNLTGATYTVAAGQFTVSLATSGECWVQVTSPASIAPLLEGRPPGWPGAHLPVRQFPHRPGRVVGRDRRRVDRREERLPDRPEGRAVHLHLRVTRRGGVRFAVGHRLSPRPYDRSVAYGTQLSGRAPPVVGQPPELGADGRAHDPWSWSSPG